MVIAGVIVGIRTSGQVLGRRLEIVLILGIDVLVVVLLLVVLFLALLVVLFLSLLLVLFLTLLLVLFLALLLVMLLVLLLLQLSIIRHIGASAVIPRGIVIQLHSWSTVVSVWAPGRESVSTASIMRWTRGIVRWARGVVRGSTGIMGTLIIRGRSFVMMVVAMVGVVDLWGSGDVGVLVIVLVVKRLLDSVLLLVEYVAHLIDQVLVGSDVQVDQRFEHLLSVVVFGDLEGDERIYVHNAQIKAVGGNGTEIGILGGMGPIGIEGISVGGVGESEGDTERWLNLLIA